MHSSGVLNVLHLGRLLKDYTFSLPPCLSQPCQKGKLGERGEGAGDQRVNLLKWGGGSCVALMYTLPFNQNPPRIRHVDQKALLTNSIRYVSPGAAEHDPPGFQERAHFTVKLGTFCPLERLCIPPKD